MTRADRARFLHGIYAIVNESAQPDPIALTRAIVKSGVHLVQYRAKNGIVPEHVRAMREITRAHNALLIINDDWRAVRPYDADGVHVGPEDALPEDLASIRAMLPDRLIGVSCGTVQEAAVADASDVDYLGVGSVYATASKADAGDPIGIAGLQRVAAATQLPVAAIGGITADALADVRAGGAAMAAVISAISAAADPQEAAAALVRAWQNAR